ncbi:MAG: hypothetical protein KGR26_13450, partial [Cyanobacteria bacterium REEB65]|nr:hypothetical protein [Cyanobacteria bacterium REEB65]
GHGCQMNLGHTAGLAIGLVWGLQWPAAAAAGQPIRSLLTWADHQRLVSGLHPVPGEATRTSTLYACRFGGYETIVRVYVAGGRIVKEQIQVQLPPDRPDAVALGIINSFFAEFYGRPDAVRELWPITTALGGSLSRSGLKQESGEYLGIALSLHLDTSGGNTMRGPDRDRWGTLVWTGQATLPPNRWPR